MTDERVIRDMSPGIALPTPNNQAFHIAKLMAQEPPPTEDGGPPHGGLTETGFVQWAVGVADTDIALQEPSTTAVVGSLLLIDAEWMTVNDISNEDNLAVTRTAPVEHDAGAEVQIFAPAEEEEGEGEGEVDGEDEDQGEVDGEEDEEPARKAAKPTPSPPHKRTTAPPHHSAKKKAPAKKTAKKR
jgi:hypothetical protein